jgi:hypothetical protein
MARIGGNAQGVERNQVKDQFIEARGCRKEGGQLTRRNNIGH